MKNRVFGQKESGMAGIYGPTTFSGGMKVGEAGVAKEKAESQLKDIEKTEESRKLTDEEIETKKKLITDIDKYNGILEEAKKAYKDELGQTNANSSLEKDINDYKLEQARKQKEASEKSLKDVAGGVGTEASRQAQGIDITSGLNKSKDFKTTQAGLALLDKGDMAFNPAIGIGGNKGAFVNEVLSKMGLFDAPMAKGAGGNNASYQINLGGIQVNGNIEDPVVVRQAGQKLTQMVEQVILKHEREKMLAKV
jgi:hypothetical protein